MTAIHLCVDMQADCLDMSWQLYALPQKIIPLIGAFESRNIQTLYMNYQYGGVAADAGRLDQLPAELQRRVIRDKETKIVLPLMPSSLFAVKSNVSGYNRIKTYIKNNAVSDFYISGTLESECIFDTARDIKRNHPGSSVTIIADATDAFFPVSAHFLPLAGRREFFEGIARVEDTESVLAEIDARDPRGQLKLRGTAPKPTP